ncbi:S-adenosylmethionine tRNA ribosyltransferase [Marinitoga sp. 1135]|uniref:S-adenosylmethionine:tRNA ribosyltransferase-isomerase n=1 Tax=Marinitoga piezophila (strain DSM 14283 / JCM 11233 / KA3) TaxID=443254 RepID=H2J4X7_MARPK|nr:MULTISPECIES: tRNA preQ1(34) S-adenosylmethionine ribosyltransferase-isomerase QueA [Marinitoga]AEX84912.1 S-adenosylmethionine:tRNA ribosyltransferase-isomerase [Marinitoga piezophila KA3]APT75419.1 S-adenosylmethionine tRNA ribosyltransferase [Marinitoga sp. 1137]NUU95146.1 S-adenosylmethionine tRNA ribosyltransferase [Marinitoga sp. 1135]NUU97078.1 S-adenosylmethionine tRNA ribosyltransferase [Marinitoga sp. 1138]
MRKPLYKVEDFDYHLPEEYIAQKPAEPRDSSRLMVLNRNIRTIEHKIFRNIIDYLKPGDLMVLNNTKVIPARLYGRKTTGAKVEVLLLEKTHEENTWKALVKPGSKLKKGAEIKFSDHLYAKIIEHNSDGSRIIHFTSDKDVWEEIERVGNMPLPPYIKSTDVPGERYQTEYAKIQGAVAAPTAGLHFTKELLNKIKEKGIEFAEVTLHVGLGTFRPVKVDNIEEHEMHEEYYEVPAETMKKIREYRQNKGRIISVGTTVVRTLETIAQLPEQESYMGTTDIFIYPPYEFKLIDALITNFHLPKSTLLMLVAAFGGYDFIMEAYKKAVEEKYRFFSFGDSMFIY